MTNSSIVNKRIDEHLFECICKYRQVIDDEVTSGGWCIKWPNIDMAGHSPQYIKYEHSYKSPEQINQHREYGLSSIRIRDDFTLRASGLFRSQQNLEDNAM